MKVAQILTISIGLAPVLFADVTAQSYRITQGLDAEGEIATFRSPVYRKVAGKDTMILATLRTREALSDPECEVVSDLVARRFPAQVSPLDDKSYWFTFFVPGANVSRPGYYRFRVRVSENGMLRRVEVASPQFFRESGAFRLLIYPWSIPQTPGAVPWTDGHTRNVADVMHEVHRLLPIPAGVGNFNFRHSRTRNTGGLRYYLLPTVYQCNIGPGESADSARARCDADRRASSDFLMRLYNSGIRANADRSLDTFDMAVTMAAGSTSAGGQSCWGGQRSAGMWMSPNAGDGTGTTAAHEIAHCMGQVAAGSPNWNPGNHYHSRLWEIPLASDMYLINMRTRFTTPQPVSLMNGAVANIGNTYLQSYEWNQLLGHFQSRSGLLSRRDEPERPLLASLAPIGVLFSQNTSDARSQKYGFVGTLDRKGTLRVTYAARLGVIDAEPMAPAEKSDYALAFYDKSGKLVGRHEFAPAWEGPHGKSDAAGLSLIAPFPASTARVTVEHGSKQIFEATCDGIAPTIADVSVTTAKQGRLLKWKATHPKDRQIFFGMEFGARSDEMPVFVPLGTDSQAALSDLLMPSGKDLTFGVRASDGCTEVNRSGIRVKVTARPPLLDLRSPATQARGPLVLQTVSFDSTDGPLGNESIRWFKNGRAIGSGTTIELPHSDKPVSIKVIARNSSGRETTVTRLISPAQRK